MAGAENIPEHILVIRLSALGDLTMCFQPFHEIRLAHPHARIALLVSPAFAGYARLLPWFDEVLVDERPSFTNIAGWLGLVRRIRAFAPTRVYDLQGKRRQSILYAALGGALWGPEWSGAAPLCSHPRLWPPTKGMSFIEFLAAQLRRAGVPQAAPANLSWFAAPLDGFNLPERYALLVAGCSPGHDYKRWPADKYAELAKELAARGITPLLIGTKLEAGILQRITELAPQCVNLAGKTSLPELASLARKAAIVVGNDTGPMHIAAAVGAPVLALFSASTKPDWTAPRRLAPDKPRVAWVQREPLASLGVDEVLLALDGVLDKEGNQ